MSVLVWHLFSGQISSMEKLEALEPSLEPALVHTWQGTRTAGHRTPQSLLNPLNSMTEQGRVRGSHSSQRAGGTDCAPCGTVMAACCCGLMPPMVRLLWDGPLWPLPSPVLAHSAIGLSVCAAAGTVHCGLLNQFGSLWAVSSGRMGWQGCPCCWRRASAFTASSAGGNPVVEQTCGKGREGSPAAGGALSPLEPPCASRKCPW